MKNNYLVSVLFTFITGIHAYAQNSKDIINLKKVYDFINTTMTNDTLKFNLSDNTELGIFTHDTSSVFSDTLFKKEDISYFRQQLSMLHKTRWQKGKIKGANIIPAEQISHIFNKGNGWIAFRKKYGKCLTSFSLPIFNKRFDYCICYHWTQCDYLYGGGSLDLYQYVNGKWVFVKSYAAGVS